MRDTVLLVAAFVVIYFGFSCLALAMARHWRQVTGAAEMGHVAALRLIGGFALFAGLCVAIYSDGPSFGATLWVVLLSLAAICVVATLTWRPLWLKPVAALFRP